MRALVLALLLIVPNVMARVSYSQYKEDAVSLNYITRFGFLAGATATASMMVDPPVDSQCILICTEKQWRMIHLRFENNAQLCASLPAGNITCFFVQPFTGSASFNDVIPSKDMYYFATMNCGASSVEATLNYQFLNPHDQQLSWEFIPLPYMFLVLFFVWLPLLLAWCFNWFRHREQKINLHRIISLFPLLKVIWCAFATVYWYSWAKTGNVSDTFTAIYEGLFIFNRSILVGVFLLIARGYCIVENNIGVDKFVILGSILLVAASDLGGMFYGGILRLVVMGSYAIVVFLIFVYIYKSSEKLQQDQIPDIDVVGAHLQGTNTRQLKQKMLRNYNLLMVAYVVLVVMVVWMQFMFLYDYYWLVQLLFESLELLMFILLALTFRLRKDNVYYRIEGAAGGTDKKILSQNTSVQEESFQWNDNGIHVQAMVDEEDSERTESSVSPVIEERRPLQLYFPGSAAAAQPGNYTESLPLTYSSGSSWAHF